MYKARAVIGLFFGDEGKGTIVGYLARKAALLGIAPLISRFNGGSQAGHAAFEGDRGHIYHQIGSGTFIDGVGTFIPSTMLVDPGKLIGEEMALKEIGVRNILGRLSISKDAPVIFPFHVMLGRLLEIGRGDNPFGSVGMGVGQAVLDIARPDNAGVVFKDLLDRGVLKEKICILLSEKTRIMDELLSREFSSGQQEEIGKLGPEFGKFMDAVALTDMYNNYGHYFRDNISSDSFLIKSILSGRPVIFEGAQGTLLDPKGGFPPYVTKTNTTFNEVQRTMSRSEAAFSNEGTDVLDHIETEKIGVLRAYGHRHGPGPFVTQTDDPAFANFFGEPDADPKWQGQFRLGHMDLVALRYAIALNGGMDSLAVTNLDRLGGADGIPPVQMCNSYLYEGGKSLLDKYFIWNDLGKNRARITDIRVPDISSSSNEPFELAGLLMKCKPLENVHFGIWSEDINCARGLSDLPFQARDLISFIGSQEGLGVPVKIVSVGQTSDDKFEIE